MADNAVDLLEWHPLPRNSLRGFATVRLPYTGLTIAGVGVHTSHGKSWTSLPSKPLVDRDGQAMRDPATGKVRYAPILQWASRDVADRFSAAVLAEVERRHPGALGGAEGDGTIGGARLARVA